MSEKSVGELEMKVLKAIDGEIAVDALFALGVAINKVIRSGSKDNWENNIENFCKSLKKSILAADLEESQVTPYLRRIK